MFRQKLLLWMMIGVLLLAGCGGDEPEAVEPETAVSQPTAQTEQAAAAETAVEPTSVPVAVELTAVSPMVTPLPTEPPPTATAEPAPDVPTGEPQQVLLDAMRLSLNSGPYRTTVTLTSDDEGVTTLVGEVVPPDQMHVTTTTSGVTTEMIILADQMWMKPPDSAWMQFPGGMSISQITQQFMLDPEAAGMTFDDVAFAGIDTLNGEPTWMYDYRSTFDAGTGPIESQGRLWISIASGRPLQQTSKSESDGVVTTILQVIEYDPAITVEAPEQ